MAVTAAVLLMNLRAARILIAQMVRVDILAGESLDECNYETASAAAACMHVKTDDAHRVPYCQQNRKYFQNHILHYNLQS